MKLKLIAFALLGALFMASCTESESDEFCENPDAVCPDDTAIEASSCCTDQQCYWQYNGTTYNCDGDNCTSVINQIVADACVASANGEQLNVEDIEVLKLQMRAVTQKLLVEARGAAGCY